jgi:tRNA pseudouridine55 synthase
MDGILIIDKPAGMTSHDVVAKGRRILKTKRIGHTGTLDPFATGVMVLLIGKATRLAQFLDKDAKEYDALVRFGYETDTGDLTGEQRATSDELQITNYELQRVSADQIENVLPEFRGEITQTPPMYSAKKVEGKKLYELARKGIEIERKAVPVTIHKLDLTDNGQRTMDNSLNISDLELKTQDFKLTVLCSAGTYIRTLAEDIGRRIGVGAHLAALRRTKAGKFDLSQAVTLENLEKIVSENKLGEILVSMNDAVSHLAEMKLDENELNRIKNGMKVWAKEIFQNTQTIRLTDSQNNLVAIGSYDEEEKLIRPRLVLVN